MIKSDTLLVNQKPSNKQRGRKIRLCKIEKQKLKLRWATQVRVADGYHEQLCAFINLEESNGTQ